MTTPMTTRLTDCNPSDDAINAMLPTRIYETHEAQISEATYLSLRAAREFLDTDPNLMSVHAFADLTCATLDDALDDAEYWREGSVVLIVYRHSGVFLRLVHEDNRQAEVEFTVRDAAGHPLLQASTQGEFVS